MKRVNGQEEEDGDNGSPRRNPRPCLMGYLSIPMSKTLDDVEERRVATHPRNQTGNPRFLRKSERKSHLNKSEIFLMSSLQRKDGFLFRWKHLARLRTYMKFSKMLLFFMTALRAFETTLFMCGAKSKGHYFSNKFCYHVDETNGPKVRDILVTICLWNKGIIGGI